MTSTEHDSHEEKYTYCSISKIGATKAKKSMKDFTLPDHTQQFFKNSDSMHFQAVELNYSSLITRTHTENPLFSQALWLIFYSAQVHYLHDDMSMPVLLRNLYDEAGVGEESLVKTIKNRNPCH